MNYEFHVTLENADKELFKSFCYVNKIKPIILDIQTKDGNSIYEEVMTSNTLNLKSDYEALKYLYELSSKLKKNGFNVIREKIECETNHKDVNKLLKSRYLESHLNVFIENSKPLFDIKNICSKYNIHLSKNINKVQDNGYTLMVTYRENCKLHLFKRKLNKIKKEICDYYIIEKEVIEYALYDTNLNYDKKWTKE